MNTEQVIDIDSCVIGMKELAEICNKIEHFKQELNSENETDYGLYAETTFKVILKNETRSTRLIDEFIGDSVITSPNEITVSLMTCDFKKNISISLHFKDFNSRITISGEDGGWVLLTTKNFEALFSKYKRQWFTSKKRKALIASVLSVPIAFIYLQLFLSYSDNLTGLVTANFLGNILPIYMLINWAYPKIEFQNPHSALKNVRKLASYVIAAVPILYIIYLEIK